MEGIETERKVRGWEVEECIDLVQQMAHMGLWRIRGSTCGLLDQMRNRQLWSSCPLGGNVRVTHAKFRREAAHSSSRFSGSWKEC